MPINLYLTFIYDKAVYNGKGSGPGSYEIGNQAHLAIIVNERRNQCQNWMFFTINIYSITVDKGQPLKSIYFPEMLFQ